MLWYTPRLPYHCPKVVRWRVFAVFKIIVPSLFRRLETRNDTKMKSITKRRIVADNGLFIELFPFRCHGLGDDAGRIVKTNATLSC